MNPPDEGFVRIVRKELERIDRLTEQGRLHQAASVTADLHDLLRGEAWSDSNMNRR